MIMIKTGLKAVEDMDTRDGLMLYLDTNIDLLNDNMDSIESLLDQYKNDLPDMGFLHKTCSRQIALLKELCGSCLDAILDIYKKSDSTEDINDLYSICSDRIKPINERVINTYCNIDICYKSLSAIIRDRYEKSLTGRSKERYERSLKGKK